jgi:hypothetical protein
MPDPPINGFYNPCPKHLALGLEITVAFEQRPHNITT